MNLKKALIVIGINEVLNEKKFEGSELVKKGLFENCKELNEAILVIREFIED